MKYEKVVYNDKLIWTGRDPNSDFWDEHWSDHHTEQLNKTELPLYVGKALKDVPQEARILDAGCGAGLIVKALSSRGYDVSGIDFTERTINFLRSQMPNIDFRYGDVRDTGYDDSTFDAYLSLGVVEHFNREEEVISALNEAIRITKPGGSLFASVPFINVLRKRKIEKKVYRQVQQLPNDYYQRAFSVDQFKRVISGLPLFIDGIIYYDAALGICSEVKFLEALKKSAITRAPFQLLNRYTCFLREFSHMVGFILINSKDDNKGM